MALVRPKRIASPLVRDATERSRINILKNKEETMLPAYAFGFDYGNAETCGYLIENSVKRARVLPSATALGSLSELAEKRSALGDTYARPVDALKSDEYVIEIGGSEYFVGALALNDVRASSTGRGDVNRYWSPKSLAVLLTVSGIMIQEATYELYVVTGLPIETFTKDNREKVKSALDGEHDFVLNGRKRRAIVHVVRVVMEGAGAMIVYGKNEDVLQGVIDVGGRTTDLYVAQGQKTQVEMCKGKPLGVESIADLVSAKFSIKYNRPLTGRETRKLLRAYLTDSNYPVIQAYGVRPEKDLLQAWIETSIKDVAQEIISFVSSTWNASERGAVA